MDVQEARQLQRTAITTVSDTVGMHCESRTILLIDQIFFIFKVQSSYFFREDVVHERTSHECSDKTHDDHHSEDLRVKNPALDTQIQYDDFHEAPCVHENGYDTARGQGSDSDKKFKG